MIDLLRSWNDSPTKSAITDFVARVTEEGGSHYVEPAARVAVFDNDGTLWTEKPLVIQLDFTIRRFRELAEEDPSLRDQQPYQAAYERDLHWMAAAMVKHYRGDDSDLKLLMVAVPRAFESVTIEDYDRSVKAFFGEADNPGLRRPYRSCGYTPMIELLRYLEANDFVTYIASGGDRDFMRPVAQEMYGIPPERIIGSALGISYSAEGGQSLLMYKGGMDFFLACGNSNGDVPMLEYAGGDSSPALRLLLLHDDADREFDYTAGAEHALDVAAQQDWTVVSMRNDWNTVFPDGT
jgi:phosphoglycolate phosphatase-like HAD superfamily hydrolase